jgi:hypothetical protein
MGPLIQPMMPPLSFLIRPAPNLPSQTHFRSASKARHVRHFAAFPRPKLAHRGAL